MRDKLSMETDFLNVSVLFIERHREETETRHTKHAE